MADQARRGDWAYGVVIRLFPPLFVAIYVAFFVKRFYTSSGLLSAVGDPVASDFTMFWIASGLILDGAAAAVFDWPGMMAAEHALVPGMSGVLGWSYPADLHALRGAVGTRPLPVVLCAVDRRELRRDGRGDPQDRAGAPDDLAAARLSRRR